jgi:hypothetical protein
MDRKILIGLGILFALVAYWYFFMRKKTPEAQAAAVSVAAGGDDLTVYGTMECGWTQKQLKYLDDNSMKYSFVNCKDGKCPPDVKSYPTMLYKGQRITGYNELSKD